MLALPEGGGRKKKQQPEEDDSQRETAREPEEETARGREEPARQRRSKKKNLTSTLTSTLDPVWQRMAASQLASVKGPAKSQPLYDYDYDYDDYDCDCDYNFIDSSAIDLSTSTLYGFIHCLSDRVLAILFHRPKATPGKLHRGTQQRQPAMLQIGWDGQLLGT